jgi:TonB-linked SusC/RagA family outer membrane protein
MNRVLRQRIVVFAGAALAALAPPHYAAAQGTGTIQGEVREAGSLRPLSTMQVHIPATGAGTLTNSSGRYQLVNVPAGPVTVVVTGVGYGRLTETVTVVSGQVATANFSLSPSAIELDELVVTGAGQATQIRKLGNTVATINTRELEALPISNMSEVLQGREPGVVALPTGGVAGEGTKIRIRGTSTLSQSNDPIIYVDGVRVDNAGGMGGLERGGGSPSRLDDINPASIERIEILKGAAAATLYGTEASNGVIQIFTKSGTAGEPRWNLQIEQGMSNYPESRYKPHAGFARTAAEADRLSDFWGMQISPYEVFEVNMWPQMFETGDFSTQALSVNGGNADVTYFVSGRILNENGPFRNDGFGGAEPGFTHVEDINRKRQANANLTFRPWDDVRIRVNSMYVDGYQEVMNNNNSIYGTISNLINSKPERADDVNLSGAVPAFGSVREMMNHRTMQDMQRFSGSVGAQYAVFDALNLDLTLGVDLVTEQNVNFVPFGWNVDRLSAASPEGSRTARDRNQRQYTADLKSSWNEDISPLFNSALVVGAQVFFTETMRTGGTGSRFPGPGLEVIGAGADQSVFEQRISQVSGGVFAQEQIGFADYLFVTAGARFDKHSAFGQSSGGALYPKFSISFVPTDMPTMPASDLLSSVRIRAAVGQSGLQPGAFDKYTTFSPLNSESGPGVAPENLGNPDLKPEVSTEYEGGIDLGLLSNRISVNATYWDRTVTDVLIARQFAPSGGFRNTQLDNIGEMTARGVELGISGMVVNTPAYSLDLFANTAYLKETVTDLGGAPPLKPGYYRYGNWVREGYAPGAFFGPRLIDAEYPMDVNGDGNPDTRDELLAFFAQPRRVETIRTMLQPGIDGDPLLHYLGKPTPDWAGSFGGRLTFLQNFNLSSLFEYKAGNYHVHNLTDEFRRSHGLIGRNIRASAETEAVLLNPASTAEQRVEAAKRWATEMAALSPQDRLNAIEAADFIRLRELSLSYRVPEALVGRFGMSSLELTAAGRNLALWTKYSGVDPELNVVGGRDSTPGSSGQEFNNFVSGVEGWGFAMPRRVTFSASIGF